jgi:hypothetical protein
MNSGRREDLGQPVQELESGEAEGGAAGGIGLRQDVENLIRAVADQVEAVEGEGRPSTVADEPFQPLPVGGLDADAGALPHAMHALRGGPGVEAEPTAVIPAEHVPGVVGLQEAVTDHVAEDPFSHRVL